MATINVINSNNPVQVALGGTGVATRTAYSPTCAGTSATGPFQDFAVGAAGRVLMSQGAASLPTWGSKIGTIGSSTDNAVVRWDGVSGAVVQDTSFTLVGDVSDPSFHIIKSESGNTMTTTVSNTSNTASSQARLQLTVAGGTANDAISSYTVTGVGGWFEGIDNSDSDKFKIDWGTLATGNVFVMTPAGENTMTKQPAFLVGNNANQTNVTGDGTTYTITYDTEIYDQGANFSANTFTAPVACKVHFTSNAQLGSVGASHSGYYYYISTSNRDYFQLACSAAAMRAAGGALGGRVAVAFADMDAGDTATVKVQVSGSTKTILVQGDGASVANGYLVFMGILIC